MKKRAFNLPFLGYDHGEKYGWEFDVLIGQYGNPVIGIQIKNPVEQYSADPEGYLTYHALLNQIIAIVGENHIIQKIDIFSKQLYTAEKSKAFLQQKYSEHFDGREYRRIDTLLLFTDRIEDNKKKYRFSEKRYKELRDKMLKVHLLLENHQCKPQFLFEKQWDHFMGGILSMHLSTIPKLDNVKTGSEHLRMGKRYVKTISFVDVEKIELPNEIEPYSILGGSGSAADTAVDNFSFFNELEECQTLIYNQVISIPPQAITQRALDKKKRRLLGAVNSNPSNGINAKEIEELLYDVAVNGQLIVDAHFSVCFSAKNLDAFEKTASMIESKLFTKGIVVSKDSENQMELFRSCFPGNAVELREYDFFKTTSEAGLCFFFKESYPVNEESNFYLRFTDRQGVPLKVDPSDVPMKTGRINNRNKFVLGPSGSGKSFLMNNIVEQYLNYNYDVVIVDTGDSYSGTCAYKGGKYIQYTEEQPITMNPFLMNKKEFNIEKMEFLTNLIFLIWQGPNAEMTPTQKSILDNALLSYYHQFYHQDSNWYEDKTTEELLLHLNKYNIYEEDIVERLTAEQRKSETYYDILGIPFDATNEQIKENGRKLIKQYHPDANRDDATYDPDNFYKVYEAYDTLIDEERRRIYNKTALILAKAQDMAAIEKETFENYEEAFRNALVKQIKILDKELIVPELKFNSFYDFCAKFLPIYLNNKNHKIKESEFNLRTFLFVLKDFYKGGRYATTLNESADNSLFEESFIVFEIDNVKDNPKLFPIVTLIIMDTFIQKMRLRKNRRKALIIEEAWKAIASKLMGGYILYLYKTVRKFWGEAIVVTQELDDIIGNAVVKDSIINNSDTFILLDQTKFKDNFDKIASLLSLNQVEQNKIFTINNLNNKFGRSRFKEFYIKRGSVGEVYGNEVSTHQYLTYTTEKPEKTAVGYYLQENEEYDTALDAFVQDLYQLNHDLGTTVSLTNLYQKPIDEDLVQYYRIKNNDSRNTSTIKEIENEMSETGYSLTQLVQNYHDEFAPY